MITARLRGKKLRLAADIGCGTGRYDQRLARALGPTCRLFCVDFNHRMLQTLQRHIRREDMQRLVAVRARAEHLPFPDGSLDCLFTFNAVHHFDRVAFFEELERALKPGGVAFIYTRFRSQNRRHIWGKYFPAFAEKETRLFERHEIVDCVLRRPSLRLEGFHHFVHRRQSDLVTLMLRAENHCYSTFALYRPEEFRSALLEFQKRLLAEFPDPGDIRWQEENVMAIVRKIGE